MEREIELLELGRRVRGFFDLHRYALSVGAYLTIPYGNDDEEKERQEKYNREARNAIAHYKQTHETSKQ